MTEEAAKDRAVTLLMLLVAALLFSAVGLIAKVTPLQPWAIGFGRAVFAAGALALYLLWKKQSFLPASADWGKIVWAAIGQAGNWGFFFAAIKTGGMAVAVLALFVYPIITAFAEPLLTRQKVRGIEVAGGLLVLAGVFFVTPEPSLGNNITLGVAMGVISAVFLTVRNIVGGLVVESTGAVRLNLWMCLVCIPLFLPFRVADPLPPSWTEAWQIAALAVLFTVAPQVIFFSSLKKVTTAWASLVVSSQPIFTILLGIILLQDVPDPRTLGGGALILAAVILVSVWGRASKPSNGPSPDS